MVKCSRVVVSPVVRHNPESAVGDLMSAAVLSRMLLTCESEQKRAMCFALAKYSCLPFYCLNQLLDYAFEDGLKRAGKVFLDQQTLLSVFTPTVTIPMHLFAFNDCAFRIHRLLAFLDQTYELQGRQSVLSMPCSMQ